MRTLVVGACAAVLVAAGCGRPRTHETTTSPRPAVEPNELVASFASRLPDPLRVVNTATFELGWQTLAVLGVTTIDAAQGSFAVVGLHPTGGVKLFEVAGDRGSVHHRFAQPALLERGDLPGVVAEDTRRIYLDRVPSPGASWKREENGIRFRQPHGKGELDYVFDSSSGLLVEKSFAEEDHRVWTIRYLDYLERAGRVYPESIVLEHHDHGYRLVLRLKEVLS